MAKEPGTQNLDVIALGRGTYRVSDGITQHVLYAAGTAEARWVFFDGRVFVIDVNAGPSQAIESRQRSTDDEMALASPMPATVVSIGVATGQEVAQDDVLVMLEAMKMELPIKAPRNGRVKAIRCAPGDLVRPGVQLIELE